MSNENFENKLRTVCTEDIYIPQKFTYAIKSGLYENNRKWRFIEMKKTIASILCIVFMGTGIVLASNSLWNHWNNKGVKTAIEYGYVQNVEMDYNIQNDLGIKLDSIIIDNSNIGIVFNYKIPSNLKSIDNIAIKDIVIKDEKNNIIFEDGNEKSLSTGYAEEFASENSIVKQAILLNNLNHTYPKSNNIYISFSTVNIFRNQKNIKTITGNWNFDINVTDKFINRETIEYTAGQSKDIEVISAELTSTGLDIEMRFNFPLNAENLGKNIKIQDNDKNEYFLDKLSVENELTTPTIKTSFPITIYNAHDNLKLIIKTDKEIIIDLNKIK
jgi:hypothetical protein